MLKVLVMCCVATVWLQMPSGASAECCHQRFSRFIDEYTGRWAYRRVCGDCARRILYCSFGGCNIFGCNCAGGCRSGRCFRSSGKRELRMPSEDARDVIRAADIDGDGRMSLEEANLHLASTGLPVDHVKRALEQLDYNQDQFITEQEIDSDYK